MCQLTRVCNFLVNDLDLHHNSQLVYLYLYSVFFPLFLATEASSMEFDTTESEKKRKIMKLIVNWIGEANAFLQLASQKGKFHFILFIFSLLFIVESTFRKSIGISKFQFCPSDQRQLFFFKDFVSFCIITAITLVIACKMYF